MLNGKPRTVKAAVLSKFLIEALVEGGRFVAAAGWDKAANVTRVGELDGVPIYYDPVMPERRMFVTYEGRDGDDETEAEFREKLKKTLPPDCILL